MPLVKGRGGVFYFLIFLAAIIATRVSFSLEAISKSRHESREISRGGHCQIGGCAKLEDGKGDNSIFSRKIHLSRVIRNRLSSCIADRIKLMREY